MSGALDAESLRRLNTWTGAIAQILRPEAPLTRTAEGIRLGRKGSLSITAADGWFDHEAGKGGRDALSLICHLRECSAEAAAAWARGWLVQHLGDGDFAAGGTAEELRKRPPSVGLRGPTVYSRKRSIRLGLRRRYIFAAGVGPATSARGRLAR